MMQELDHFYFNQQEPQQSALLAMRNIVLKQDAYISESLKWNMPCFSYKNKMFCFLWVDKKTQEPYYLMVEGNHLEHPSLEKGSRERMKIFRVNPQEDLPIQSIELILNQALDLYRNGIIKVK